MTGTTPRGVHGEAEASRWVREMFGRVAPRYDLLNHLLSFNLDKHWRKLLVQRVAPKLVKGARALDLCCGTADVLLSVGQASAGLFGSDFCHPMLVEAKRKVAANNLKAPLFEADALALPLANNTLDLITIAFGFRNLANYEDGLKELHRVLKPGGMLAILEFSQPPNKPFAALYNFFSLRVLPKVGGIVSGAPEAYTYLPESIRKFPGAEQLATAMRTHGYSNVSFERMTGGAVALHVGVK
jgi:demethylmenaquinone methyltransferase/2-methoxy-6-polyprenyl-1,4-benzoquinol methylase